VLYRQKVLLLILQQVGGKADNLQMMKWAFLLSQETNSRGGKTFYQFIPYRYGPYSFTLNQETDSLIRSGFLEKDINNSWNLTNIGEKLDTKLPILITQDVNNIVNHYGDLSSQELINLVYEKYAWFTINSEIEAKRCLPRPKAETAIYTAGYEGKTVDEFLNILLKWGIHRLIDIRYNPISRRYGFHKSTLSRLCHHLAIDYQHLPTLGIAGSDRKDLNSVNSYTSLFENYHFRLSSQQEDLLEVMNLLKSQPSVLVCMEANPAFCHRHILAEYLTNVMDMPIKNL
jgi:uncharacterized protein (DUF488 family)